MDLGLVDVVVGERQRRRARRRRDDAAACWARVARPTRPAPVDRAGREREARDRSARTGCRPSSAHAGRHGRRAAVLRERRRGQRRAWTCERPVLLERRRVLVALAGAYRRGDRLDGPAASASARIVPVLTSVPPAAMSIDDATRRWCRARGPRRRRSCPRWSAWRPPGSSAASCRSRDPRSAPSSPRRRRSASVAAPYWIRATPVPPVSASEPWRISGGVPVNVPPLTVSTSAAWSKVMSPLLVNVPAVCSNVEPSPLSNRNSTPDATVTAPALVHLTACDKLATVSLLFDLERASGGVVDVAVDHHAAAVGLRRAQDAAVGELLARGDRQERLVVLVAGRGELDQAGVVDVAEARLGGLEAWIGAEAQRPLDRELVGRRDARFGERDRRRGRDAGVLRAGRGGARRPVGIDICHSPVVLAL